jgi:hypothetical protein
MGLPNYQASSQTSEEHTGVTVARQPSPSPGLRQEVEAFDQLHVAVETEKLADLTVEDFGGQAGSPT